MNRGMAECRNESARRRRPENHRARRPPGMPVVPARLRRDPRSPRRVRPSARAVPRRPAPPTSPPSPRSPAPPAPRPAPCHVERRRAGGLADLDQRPASTPKRRRRRCVHRRRPASHQRPSFTGSGPGRRRQAVSSEATTERSTRPARRRARARCCVPADPGTRQGAGGSPPARRSGGRRPELGTASLCAAGRGLTVQGAARTMGR